MRTFTFTQKVAEIGKFIHMPGETVSMTKVAKHLKVNDSTLRNALKADTEEKPYTGSLAAIVDEAFKLVPVKSGKKPTKKPGERSAPRGRLHKLVRVNDGAWTAAIGETKIDITRGEDNSWAATVGKDAFTAKTFKDIIGALREHAKKVAA